jgi:hypothetical protein
MANGEHKPIDLGLRLNGRRIACGHDASLICSPHQLNDGSAAMAHQEGFTYRHYAVMGSLMLLVIIVFILSTLPTPRQWTSALPPQLQAIERLYYGSTQLADGRGNCGAVIYRISTEQTKQILHDGPSALPTGMREKDGREFDGWKTTPMPSDVFDRFVVNNSSQVGLNCSHGTWEKNWRRTAVAEGNFYTESATSLILLDTQTGKDRPATYIEAGYFYNP